MSKEIRYGIYIILTLLAMVYGYKAISHSDNKNIKPEIEQEFIYDIPKGVTILTIDGCEYIWIKRGYGGGLTHKGNCKNH